jgi:uncharacterized protein
MTDAATSPNPAKPCPICGKPGQPAFLPFCSSRCADVDLHRWLSGVYRVETPESAEDERPEDGNPGE